ncbi:MAG: iron-sulfur cluster assembly accessory protein [Parachlamydiales bacterium]
MTITRTLTIDQIFELFPSKAQKLAGEMSNTGLQCVGCHAATWETLEAGMYGHGFEDGEIDALVDRLNAILAEEEAPADTITLTKRAADKYRQILAAEGKAGWGIRLSEKAAGCHGFEHALDYSERAKEGDETFVSEGVEVHVDQAYADRLLGCEIDYVDGLQGSGFKISNPNVRSSCGCGSSHGY